MDVLELLLEDHQRVKELFSRIAAETGSARQQLFDTLRESLVRHEVAEEEILRPLTKSSLADGEAIAARRIAEESEAEETLKKMEKSEIGSAEWEALFLELRGAVLEHAEKEETIEFPGLRASLSGGELEKAGKMLEKAKQMAPTHPHPGTPNTPAANMALGPLAALIDRARDAVARAKSA